MPAFATGQGATPSTGRGDGEASPVGSTEAVGSAVLTDDPDVAVASAGAAAVGPDVVAGKLADGCRSEPSMKPATMAAATDAGHSQINRVRTASLMRGSIFRPLAV